MLPSKRSASLDTDPHVLVDHQGLRLVVPRVAGEGSDARGAEAAAAVHWHDAPLLSRYAWRWWGASGTAASDLCATHTDGAEWRVLWEDEDGHPTLSLRRLIRVDRDGWTDEVGLANPGRARVALTIEFEAAVSDPTADAVVTASGLQLGAGAAAVQVAFDALAAPRPDGADWELSLAPGERVVLRADLSLRQR